MNRIIAVGKFDGVHLGHRVLLREGKRWARTNGCSFLVLTFPPQGDALLPLEVKLRLLREFADTVEVMRFEEVREISAPDFLRILGEKYGARGLIMGPGHRFGRDREGSPDYARSWGKAHGVEVRVVSPFLCQGRPISARHIREHLRRGEVHEARLLLGRYPVIFGKRTSGAGLGRKLGHPTVNLDLRPELLRPRPGVYLAWAFWDGGDAPGLFYLGTRPTFPELPPTAEVHLFSPPRPEPEGEVEVQLLAFLREDRRFPSPEALGVQISRDISRGRALLASLPAPVPFLFHRPR
ncbi:riboflavin kinase [Candidatus Bipolaricaulota sp. J31]